MGEKREMTWVMFNYLKKHGAGSQRLEQAIAESRRAASTQPGLSEEARASIVERVQNNSPSGTLPALFTPTRQLLVAGALPLLLALALLPLIERTPPPVMQPEAATTVQVSKQGDRIHFDISNGKRNHYVSRSTLADRSDGPVAMVTEGSYVDRISDDESLVFYRID